MYKTYIYNNSDELSLNELIKFYETIYADKASQIAKGENISVAVLDSGVDFFHNRLVNKIYDTYNAVRDDKEALDQLGHGTYIAGLINGINIGLCMNVKLHCVKITDDSNNFKITAKAVIKAIDWCINNKIDIVCMPFSSDIYDSDLEAVIKKGTHIHNMIFISSAGNDPKSISYPAKYDDVISVGSLDYSLKHAEFSGIGNELDITCIGVNIPSLYSYNRFAVSSGSSSSAAIATSLITIVQQLKLKEYNTKFNIFQLRKWIKNNSVDLGEIGHDSQYGFGIISFKNTKENNYKLLI